MSGQSDWRPPGCSAAPRAAIVAFVTNGGFIESNAFDGFRKALAA